MIRAGYKTFFGFLSVYALLVFFVLLKHHDINGIESTDCYFYLFIAKSGAEGGKLTHPVYSPGYSWIIIPVYKLLGDLELAGRVVSFIFGVMSVFVFFVLMRWFFGDTHALLSSAFLALNPDFVSAEISTLPYSTAFFFFWTSVLFSVWAKDGKVSPIFLSFISGVLCGFGYVVRPEIALFIIAHALITRSVMKTISFLLGFFVSSLPYHIITFQEGYLPSFISKFLGYRLPEYSAGEVKEFVEKVAGDKGESMIFIKKLFEIKKYVKTFVSNIHLSHKYGIPNLITASQIFVAGMGFAYLVLWLWSSKNREESDGKYEERRKKVVEGLSILICAFVSYSVPVFFLVIIADYILLPVFLPLFSTFAGFLSIVIGNGYVLVRRNMRYVKMVSVLAFLFMASLNIFYFMRPFYKDEGRKLFKIAGEWIRENLGTGLVIYEPFPFTTFYAGGIWTLNIQRAEIGVFSPINTRTARDVIYSTLPPEKIEYMELITQISYKGRFLRVFKLKNKE